MRTRRSQILLLLTLIILFVTLPNLTIARGEKKPPTAQVLVHEAVHILIGLQDEEGRWPYELSGDLGYAVASTAIVAESLLFAEPEDKDVQDAVHKTLTYVLEQLEDPSLATSAESAYEPRVWGQALALELLCHVRARKIAGEHKDKVKEWIPKLVASLVEEEFEGGGWSYAWRNAHQITCLTAPVTQVLLLARAQGEKVPDEVLTRSREVLEAARTEDGAFFYRGSPKDEELQDRSIDTVPGSAARATVCETTLLMLGGSSVDAVRTSLNNFHKYWDALEERRQQEGTHDGEYGIAPYFFYYGHRYAAQAIQMLPEKERAKER